MAITVRPLITLCFISIITLGSTGAYAISCPDNSAAFPGNGCSLPGLVSGSFPYFQQGVLVDYKNKDNKTTFNAKYQKGSESLFLTSSTDIYTITSTNYKLKATWDSTGILSGTVKINGIFSGMTPDPVRLMTADLSGDWNISGDGKLIGFNTTNIDCSGILPVLCTDAEVVYVNLADALDMNIDTFSTNGIALTSVPVPAAVWLFGSGVLGLTAVARRKRKAT